VAEEIFPAAVVQPHPVEREKEDEPSPLSEAGGEVSDDNERPLEGGEQEVTKEKEDEAGVEESGAVVSTTTPSPVQGGNRVQFFPQLSWKWVGMKTKENIIG